MTRYDVAVIIGGGFATRETTKLDRLSRARVLAAVQAVLRGQAKHLIVTGNLLHENGAVFAEYVANIAQRLGVPKSNTHVSDGLMEFACTTRGDVRQAAQVARIHEWKKLLVFTQKPHYLRTKLLFRYFSQKGEFRLGEFRRAPSAPLWFWGKELLACALLLLTKGDDYAPLYVKFSKGWDWLQKKLGLGEIPDTEQAHTRHDPPP